jgi:Ser/Thr protein kinase RdoA (MazF antagonist)
MQLTSAAMFFVVCLQTPQLLRSVGCYLARVDAALADFSHPGIRPTHDWAIERVLDAIQQFSHLLPDDTKRWVAGVLGL